MFTMQDIQDLRARTGAGFADCKKALQENDGNVDKAIDYLKKAAKMADGKMEMDVNNSISPTFLLKAGVLLESQNKKAEALKIYQDIKKNYINSALVQSSEIDKYIERVSE